jgi:divalent metal cation (Fe/Co/Zn/Cd) transporter
MKLGYKYYRNSLIKVAILSVACLGIFWDHLRGKGNPKDEPGALILIAVLMVVGNVGLFIAMRRAKRREQAETLEMRMPDETKRAG